MNHREYLFCRSRTRHVLKQCGLTPSRPELDFTGATDSAQLAEDVIARYYSTPRISLPDEESTRNQIHEWLLQCGDEVMFWVRDGLGSVCHASDFREALPSIIEATRWNILCTTTSGCSGFAALKCEHDFGYRSW